MNEAKSQRGAGSPPTNQVVSPYVFSSSIPHSPPSSSALCPNQEQTSRPELTRCGRARPNSQRPRPTSKRNPPDTTIRRAIVKDPRPSSSDGNMGGSSGRHRASTWPSLRRLPHPRQATNARTYLPTDTRAPIHWQPEGQHSKKDSSTRRTRMRDTHRHTPNSDLHHQHARQVKRTEEPLGDGTRGATCISSAARTAAPMPTAGHDPGHTLPANDAARTKRCRSAYGAYKGDSLGEALETLETTLIASMPSGGRIGLWGSSKQGDDLGQAGWTTGGWRRDERKQDGSWRAWEANGG
ncbi:hypothetical protein EDB80DRAFT_675351 [Ilyonectria destructans]|nr:hypothetical protein EDB80DRAFT_675351 [Ilyonectria destructans]